MSRIVIGIVLLFWCINTYADKAPFDSLGYNSPVDHTIRLSGNFMELRTNHFHSGIDIKSSQGRVGDPIYSIAPGYFSRIKIMSGGYGNAIYIDHPETGHTSVYAHLDAYTPEIEAYIKELQYKYQIFEIDVYLPDSLFMINKSQQIGTMGNTGRSFGPHLHFEIRDTKSERPLNPENFGIGPTDNKPPQLQSLVLYKFENDMVVDSEMKYFKPGKNKFELYNDTVTVNTDEVGLGLQMYDTMDGSVNKNGIYRYEVYNNGEKIVEWKADKFSFEQSKWINAFIDYSRSVNSNQKIYKLYRQGCNPLDYGDYGNGIISITQSKISYIELIVYDLKGNHTRLDFYVRKKSNNASTPKESIPCDTNLVLKKDNIIIDIPPRALMDNAPIQVVSSQANISNRISHGIKIESLQRPISKYYSISFPMPDTEIQKWTIVSKDKKGRWRNFSADTSSNRIFSKVDQFGEFYIYKDVVAPTIKVISFDKTQSIPWKFQLNDDLIPDGLTPDLNYAAFANGKWLRLKYDLKNDILIFDDFDELPPKPYFFKIIASDSNQNVATIRKKVPM